MSGAARCPVGPSVLTFLSPLPPSSALLVAISSAVDKVIAHFSTARNLVQKVRAGLGRAGQGGRGFGSPRGGIPHPSQQDQAQVLPFPSLPSPRASLRPSWGTAGSTLTWGTCCCTPSALHSTPWWRMG